MKTAICYYSRHHGNTRKVLEAIAGEGDVALIDVTARRAVRLEEYDRVGFASGIYFGKFQNAVLQFARQYLPQGKPVFFISTYGMLRPGYTRAIRQIAAEKNCPVLGEFGCKGVDTYGPFKLVGGIAKGRPDARDLEKARSFYQNLRQTHDRGAQP